jgi:hypothetical protein
VKVNRDGETETGYLSRLKKTIYRWCVEPKPNVWSSAAAGIQFDQGAGGMTGAGSGAAGGASATSVFGGTSFRATTVSVAPGAGT